MWPCVIFFKKSFQTCSLLMLKTQNWEPLEFNLQKTFQPVKTEASAAKFLSFFRLRNFKIFRWEPIWVVPYWSPRMAWTSNSKTHLGKRPSTIAIGAKKENMWKKSKNVKYVEYFGFACFSAVFQTMLRSKKLAILCCIWKVLMEKLRRQIVIFIFKPSCMYWPIYVWAL